MTRRTQLLNPILPVAVALAATLSSVAIAFATVAAYRRGVLKDVSPIELCGALLPTALGVVAAYMAYRRGRFVLTTVSLAIADLVIMLFLPAFFGGRG